MDFPKSTPGIGLINGQFVDEDATTGQVGSLIPAAWGNALTNEILNVIKSAGLQPDEANSAQLLAAIGQLIANNVAPSATTDRAGVVELATPQEGIAGADTVRAIVPAVLAAVLASYAKLVSPAFTGSPTAPTAAPGTNSTQLANTAFVQAAIAALVASSPAALDTLNELAAALGDDPNFATTVTNALAGKQPLLGFTPIQQGGGANQGTNKLCIGWGNDTSLKLQVDSTDFGSTWPINVTGRATGNYQMVAAQSLSGTAFDIAGIPSWAKRVTICFDSVTVSAAANLALQIGDSGGIESSGYLGSSIAIHDSTNPGAVKHSTSFILNKDQVGSTDNYNGRIVLEKVTDTKWALSSTLSRAITAYSDISSGIKALDSTLTAVRITTIAGTASLSGNISVAYEG